MAEPKLTCDICCRAVSPNDLSVIFVGLKQSETEKSLRGIPGRKFRACGHCRQHFLFLIDVGRSFYYGQFIKNNQKADAIQQNEQTAEAAVEEHEEEQEEQK